MQVSVESPSHIERRLTVVVPFEQVEEAFDKRIVKIAKTAKFKGFRPGKVPLEQVKQMYGQTARQEALSEIIQSTLYSALDQEKLNPVGAPMVEPRTVVPGQPLEYIATIEVLPAISNVNFELTQVEKEITTVEDKDVDNVIEKLREQNAKWNVVNREANNKDQIIIDFVGTIDGQPFAGGEAKNYAITLGSKMMLPGFEEGLLGAKADENRTISLTFPENYFAKDVAGKVAEFAIQVKKVFEAELPPLDENFVKRLGVKSGQYDDLKREINKNLQREANRLMKAKLKKKIFDHLVEKNPIEVPKALIERETNRLHDQLHPHHGKEHAHSDEEMATFQTMAKQNVILGLLMAELMKQHAISPDANRMQEVIQEMASAYENPEEVVSMIQKDKKNRAEIEMQVLEEQVMAKMLESVLVTEKIIPYQDFVKGHI